MVTAAFWGSLAFTQTIVAWSENYFWNRTIFLLSPQPWNDIQAITDILQLYHSNHSVTVWYLISLSHLTMSLSLRFLRWLIDHLMVHKRASLRRLRDCPISQGQLNVIWRSWQDIEGHRLQEAIPCCNRMTIALFVTTIHKTVLQDYHAARHRRQNYPTDLYAYLWPELLTGIGPF